MAGFNLSDYETVEERLEKFWADNASGRIATSVHHYDAEYVVFRAEVYRDIADSCPTATGYAEEKRGAGTVNKTNHVENCETSAIGRALANMGYATKGKRPSREEMQKAAGREETNGNGSQATDRAAQYLRDNGLTTTSPVYVKCKGKAGDKWRELVCAFLDAQSVTEKTPAALADFVDSWKVTA